jgi:hypothetical protein
MVLVGISFAGFVLGLAGKARAVNIKSVKMAEFYGKVTAVSLTLMFVFAILWKIFA